MSIKSIRTAISTRLEALEDRLDAAADRLSDTAVTQLKNIPYNNKAVIGASALLVLGTMGYLGFFSPSSTPPSAKPVQTAPASAPVDTGITITVLDDTKCPAPVNPLETLLSQAQDYVTQHSWKEIVQQYAGVQGGVIVSLRDYRGNDKEQACRLALGRLVETTIGSVADRTLPKYTELTDAIIDKGLDDCRNDIKLSGCRNYDALGRLTKDTRCYEVKFGL